MTLIGELWALFENNNRGNYYYGQRCQAGDGSADHQAPAKPFSIQRASTRLSRCELSDTEAGSDGSQAAKEDPVPWKGSWRRMGANWIME